jgi:hypothetical protein
VLRRYLSYAEQLERQRVAAARALAAVQRANEIQQRRDDRARKLAHTEVRQQEAEDRTADVAARTNTIKTLLQAGSPLLPRLTTLQPIVAANA